MNDKTVTAADVEFLRQRFNFERDQYQRAFKTAEDAIRHSIYAEVGCQALELAGKAAERAQEAWEEFQAAEANRTPA